MRGFIITERFARNLQFLSEKVFRLQTHCQHKVSCRNFSFSHTDDQIKTLLDKVRARDGLKQVQPHIEYLIGKASSSTPTDNDSGGLDIADKTQLILQSAHPVRYIVEREIKKLEGNAPSQVSYHDWVTFFGRSLGVTREMTREEFSRFEEQLNNISNAAECGMFSSEIHQTIVNIPPNLKSLKILAQFNMGNKYSVLVGDYFAIKTILFAEKCKSSPVILAITRGVEEFTAAPFSSNLIESIVWYPFIPSSKLTYQDWEDYNIKAPGYFTGGMYAVLTACPNNLDSDPTFQRQMRNFVPNINLLLKSLAELNDFESEDHTMLSPFLFTSLPAILYQQKNPAAFDYFRTKYSKYLDDSSFTEDLELIVVRREIKRSDAMAQTKELLLGYARNSKEALVNIGTDLFYVSIIHELIDVLSAAISKK